MLAGFILLIGVIIYLKEDNQNVNTNSKNKLRFEKIDHFTKITDSTELMEEVYIVHNFPLNSEAFAREAAKFLNRQSMEEYQAKHFIFLKEHEKIEIPLYEDTLNYRSKETSIEDILRSDFLGRAIKFLNNENKIKQKVSLSSFFSQNN